MEYSINFLHEDKELADGHYKLYKASVIYTFTISNGLANTVSDWSEPSGRSESK